ncbi:MAG TPA: TIGR04283 family arsenosugar biosynthesis glycosyltransferase, partial [Candidatus Deferrimicrobiaceae bacterium]|jgi:rSAM/selenodomain-associated transferase 2
MSEAAVSVVVPALDEEAFLPAALRSARDAGADELIVVDGGSADRTVVISRPLADLVIAGPRGRSSQMNAGAGASSGRILLFLHADTVLHPRAVDAVREAVLRGGCIGGAFSVRLSASPSASACTKAVLLLTGRMIGLRSKLFRAYTGDQGIFVRKDVFDALGGFPAIPLMEDVEFSRRLVRRGKTLLLPVRITTSGRRWEAFGPIRTILLMWRLRLAYSLGMSPARCAEIYRRGKAAGQGVRSGNRV